MSLISKYAVGAGVLAGIRRRLSYSEPRRRIAITEDELFILLADGRRRAVITRVEAAGSGSRIPLNDLARGIAAEETHMIPDMVPDERVEPVTTALRQTHLPMLDDAGIVSWAGDGSTVSCTPATEPIADGLDAIERCVKPVPAGGRTPLTRYGRARMPVMD